MVYVEAVEPPARRPPIVETGVLGWLHENLFSSWWNALLTIVAALFVIFALAGFLGWAVQEANWAVITNNLHLFAIGTYPQDQAWRPLAVTLGLMILAGLTWRLWGRAARLIALLVTLGVALLFVLPVITSALPFPPTYTLIGGPATDPPAGLAYLAEAGETVTFTLRPILDFTAPLPDGFMDRASLTVAGLARQEAQTRQRSVNDAQEAGENPPENLPTGAYLSYDEAAGVFIVQPPDLVAAVTIHQAIYQGDPPTLTQVDAVVLDSFSAGPEPETVSHAVTFPAAGWYVILPAGEGSVGGYWLVSDPLRPLDTTTVAVEARQRQYGPPPALAGTRVQVADTAYLPFRGTRSFAEFAKLHLGPMAGRLSAFALVIALAVTGGYGLGALASGRRWARRAALALWIASPVLVWVLLVGLTDARGGLPVVQMERWGGLLLTMILTVVGIVAAFPIGVLLALGRRSHLPIVRVFCVLSIEFVRGVPLVTVLFAASILVPLVHPSLSGVDNVVRAMVGMTFFSAAYLAEIVRGGLQAIPYGQTEAARALGMPAWQVTLLIILPQALRTVIPAIMGQFVSLFKDTSLVLIIGLLDLLGIARSVINQAEYIGLQRETLVFISVIYFVLSYLMSWSSRRLEQTGSGAVRRA